MTKLLLRESEAREMLGVSRTTLFELMRTGEIESVRIGRSRRIPVTALEEYVDRLGRGQEDGPGC